MSGWYCSECHSSYGADVDCIEEFGCLFCGAKMRKLEMSNRKQMKVVTNRRGVPRQRAVRVCSSCGYKDSSPVPPVMCPACHFQEDSPLANTRPIANRKERRRIEAQQRLQMRKTQKQIDRETAKTGGKYEAS